MANPATARENKVICPACDSAQCTEQTLVDFFPYGFKGASVVLSAPVPVMTCGECELRWTDERGEDARAAAVIAHLAGLRKRGSK